MRALAIVIASLALLNSANAQVIQITATGTITSTTGFDASVQIGGAFTETFVLNTQTLPTSTNGTLQATFSDPLATALVTFGDYSFSQTGAQIEILTSSGYAEVGYGYDISTFFSDGDSDFQVTSSNPAVFPTTALSNIVQQPISVFNSISNVFQDDLLPADVVANNLTSYSVTAVPEPSAGMLLLCGLGLIAFWRVSSRVKSWCA